MLRSVVLDRLDFRLDASLIFLDNVERFCFFF